MLVRIDSRKSAIYIKHDEKTKEFKITFLEAARQLSDIANNTVLLDQLTEYTTLLFRKTPKHKSSFQKFQSTILSQNNDSIIYFLVLNSLYSLGIYHSHRYTHGFFFSLKKYYKKNISSQLDEMINALHLFQSNSASIQKYNVTVHYTYNIASKAAYLESDPSFLFFNSFLIEFATALKSTEQELCECVICGKMFWGKRDENCCSEKICEEISKLNTLRARIDFLKKVNKRINPRIRQHRVDINEAHCPKETVNIFNSFAAPKEQLLDEKATFIIRHGVAKKEIYQFYTEREAFYKELNNLKHKLIEEYGTI